MSINFKKMEKKWQDRWESEKAFIVKENSKKPKYYVMEMFPYPSGIGLHMGHAINFTITDIFARFKRMQGYNVMFPIGYDSLGLPAENAAIKAGIHPEEYTNKSIKSFKSQQKRLGFSYDTSRLINTADPQYYKWDQWIFLKMFEKGLVYKEKSFVNWCPSCKTVLANEQAQGGICERCKSVVEVKSLEQWFLKITNYADELLEGHKNLDWPEKTIAMQKNWIGKSYGTEIDFEIGGKEKISNVIIVHGSNSTEKHSKEDLPENERHWKPWIKKELENRGIFVSNELYPEDWMPDYNKWKKVFEKNKIDENSVLIGHSAGTAFLLKWLSENKTKVRKLILVAPSVIKDGKYLDKSTLKDFNFDSSLKKFFDELVIFYADDDDEDIIGSAKAVNKKLGGKLINLSKRGHFTMGDMGTEEFPELLNKILENKSTWPVFTTRPDTIFGVTFMVISSQHEKLNEFVTKEQKSEVDKFLKKLNSVSEKELVDMEKEGVFTGSYAMNPVTNENVPVYAGNFVVADYGFGIVMAVPAHDQRDFDFAKKYNLEIKQVISGKITKDMAYTKSGELVNSGRFNGIDNIKAIREITKFLEKRNLGRKTINYRLKDWGISRQRYWGTPIPIINCEKCGEVPVSYSDLPVVLPKKVKFGEGNPLETNKKWIKTKCPKCGGVGSRETDTMDTFVNSSWYFLRYCDPNNNKKIFDSKKVDYWCPIDLYIGGAEHACMHLIYARFYTKFLRDLGLIKFGEFAKKLFHQGMLHGADGNKMSKSLGNGVDPIDTVEKYNADSLRLTLMSFASPDKDTIWDEKVMIGSNKFITKIADIFNIIKIKKSSLQLDFLLNKTIKEFTLDIENLDYRMATIKIRTLFNKIILEKNVSKNTMEKALQMFSLFAPHISEELWEKLGNKNLISLSSWPKADKSKIKIKSKSQNVEKNIISNIKTIIKKISKKQEIKKIYFYVMPFEIEKISKEKLEKEIGKKIEIFSTNNPRKYDPENKSKKARPGMPGIFVE